MCGSARPTANDFVAVAVVGSVGVEDDASVNAVVVVAKDEDAVVSDEDETSRSMEHSTPAGRTSTHGHNTPAINGFGVVDVVVGAAAGGVAAAVVTVAVATSAVVGVVSDAAGASNLWGEDDGVLA
jgi:hypothetical protein